MDRKCKFLQKCAKRDVFKITGYIQSIYKVVEDTGLEREFDDIASMRLRRLYKRAYGVKNGMFTKTTH